MNKLFLAAAAATASFTVAPSAHAAPILSITGPSGTFGDDTVTCANGGFTCAFNRTFTFTTPAGYNLTSATISSIFTGANMASNIDFSSVTLNGINFDILSTGMVEFRDLLNQSITPGGMNTLFVSGTVGAGDSNFPTNTASPANGAFAGTLSFAAGAVPETATWLMMILGFGGIGFAMRRQAKVRTTVSYA